MKSILSRIFACIMLLIFTYSLGFSQVVYSGTSYSGRELRPVTYKGKELIPISYTGSVINGVYYEGIHLTNSKVTGHIVNGQENSSVFFDKTVPEEFRVNWKKVIGKFAV